MLASLAAAAVLAQSGDVILGIVVRDSQGELATFAATMLGASRRITTKVGTGWVYTPSGWQWVQAKNGVRSSAGSAGLSTLPVGRQGEQYRITWIADGQASLGLADWVRKGPIRDVRQVATGQDRPPQIDPLFLKERMELAYKGVSETDRQDLDPMTAVSGSGGLIHKEGRLNWAVQLASATRDSLQPYVLQAPVDRLPATLWSSAKNLGFAVVDAAASDEAGWGFLVTEDEVKLAPYRSGKFSAPVRTQAWSSEAIVAFWECRQDVEERDSELRRQAPDPSKS